MHRPPCTTALVLALQCSGWVLAADPLFDVVEYAYGNGVHESGPAAAAAAMVDIFVHGDGGFPCWRVPAVVMAESTGRLFAFAEARNYSGDGCEPDGLKPNASHPNEGPRSLALKTSTDSGRSWSGLRIVDWNGINPAAVYDKYDDKIVVHYPHAYWQEGAGHPNVGGTYTKQLICSSDGLCGAPTPTMLYWPGCSPTPDQHCRMHISAGPGLGAQIEKGPHAGRLVFAGHAGQVDVVWYSDDAKTWRVSNSTYGSNNKTKGAPGPGPYGCGRPQGCFDEPFPVHLPNGVLQLNMRNDSLTCDPHNCCCAALDITHPRSVADSTDGGMTFGPVYQQHDLPEPTGGCQASSIVVGATVLFSNPSSGSSNRSLLTVRRSHDSGKSYPESMATLVWSGAGGYSCLTRLPKSTMVGLAFERSAPGCAGGSCRISFVSLPVVNIKTDDDGGDTSTDMVLTIDNTKARTNTSGQLMDAHDGSYARWEPTGDWFYYAMGYGRCVQGRDRCQHGCGYGFSWVGVWRSPDMRNGTWMLVREARDESWPHWNADNSSSGIYFRPHVIFCRQTQKYVLWLSAWFAPQCPGGSQSCWMVGVSDSPDGPFRYSGAVTGRFADGGDFDLLVDRDSSAYILYTSTAQGHRMSVEQLSDDYLRPIGQGNGEGPSNTSSGLFGAEFVEAPAIFQRRGVYYAMFGKCCCMCAQGTGVGVYTGSKPLGPFTFRRNIGCGGAVLPAGCGCGMNEDPLHRCPNRYGSSTTHAQQNVVFPIHTSSGVKHIWTGDRWQSSPSGIKAEDRQYWSPLQFSYDEQAQLELPQPLEWVRSFELRIPH
eukprot:COSAG01_NODE_971_length_12373_cov_114.625957_5_plen_820_part_00